MFVYFLVLVSLFFATSSFAEIQDVFHDNAEVQDFHDHTEGVGDSSPSFLPKESSLFDIYPITVYETAEKVTEKVRSDALVSAYRLAFSALVERMVPQEDRSLLPPYSYGVVQSMVQKVQVLSETFDSHRYGISLYFRFKPSLITSFFKNVRYIDFYVRHVIVVPLLVKEEQVRLWDGDEVLWQYWRELAETKNSYYPFHMDFPEGNLIDRVAVTGADLYQQSWGGLLKHYGSCGVFFIPILKIDFDAQKKPVVILKGSLRVGNDVFKLPEQKEVMVGSSEDFLKKMVTIQADQLRFIFQNIYGVDGTDTLDHRFTIRFPDINLKAYLKELHTLKNLSLGMREIKNIQVSKMDSSGYDITLVYTGDWNNIVKKFNLMGWGFIHDQSFWFLHQKSTNEECLIDAKRQ